jgi:hypothetical protein
MRHVVQAYLHQEFVLVVVGLVSALVVVGLVGLFGLVGLVG